MRLVVRVTQYFYEIPNAMRDRRIVRPVILMMFLFVASGSVFVFAQGGTGKLPPNRMPNPPVRKMPLPRRNIPQIDTAYLIGVKILIVHIAQRSDDARGAAERLRRLGAKVTLYETSVNDNEEWAGRIVYWESQEKLARRIAESIADIEKVTPKKSSDTKHDQTFSLWIVNEK